MTAYVDSAAQHVRWRVGMTSPTNRAWGRLLGWGPGRGGHHKVALHPTWTRCQPCEFGWNLIPPLCCSVPAARALAGHESIGHEFVRAHVRECGAIILCPILAATQAGLLLRLHLVCLHGPMKGAGQRLRAC